jgi:hypothetical protein
MAFAISVVGAVWGALLLEQLEDLSGSHLKGLDAREKVGRILCQDAIVGEVGWHRFDPHTQHPYGPNSKFIFINLGLCLRTKRREEGRYLI